MTHYLSLPFINETHQTILNMRKLRTCKISRALYIVINAVPVAGITIIGVRETRFGWLRNPEMEEATELVREA